MDRFTVEQYHRMIDGGALTENDRVELLEGWIVLKKPHNPPHDSSIWNCQTLLLSKLMPEDWIIRIRSAVTLAASEPEPDLTVARGPGQRYFRAPPRSTDIGLLLDVPASTFLS